MSVLCRFLVILVLGYAGLCTLVYVNQRNMMYYPSTGRVPIVAEAGMQEVELTTADGHRLVNWYRNAQADQPTILFFHGNAGQVASRSYRLDDAGDRGVGMFMLGYPGYGGSGAYSIIGDTVPMIHAMMLATSALLSCVVLLFLHPLIASNIHECWEVLSGDNQ